MMDNLSLHKSKVSCERMDELGFRYCWTPPYSPETNGIEEVWSQSKRYIKEQRLNALANNKEVNLYTLIYESFDRISNLSISGCINRSLS